MSSYTDFVQYEMEVEIFVSNDLDLRNLTNTEMSRLVHNPDNIEINLSKTVFDSKDSAFSYLELEILPNTSIGELAEKISEINEKEILSEFSINRTNYFPNYFFVKLSQNYGIYGILREIKTGAIQMNFFSKENPILLNLNKPWVVGIDQEDEDSEYIADGLMTLEEKILVIGSWTRAISENAIVVKYNDDGDYRDGIKFVVKNFGESHNNSDFFLMFDESENEFEWSNT